LQITKFILLLPLVVALASCDKGAANSPQEGLPAVRAALVAGNYADATTMARKEATTHPRDAATQFELARAEALSGNRGRALDAIDLAVRFGLADAAHALDDHAFDVIRSDSRFVSLANRAAPAPVGDTSGSAQAVDTDNTAAGQVQIRENAKGTHIQAGDVKLDTNF